MFNVKAASIFSCCDLFWEELCLNNFCEHEIIMYDYGAQQLNIDAGLNQTNFNGVW